MTIRTRRHGARVRLGLISSIVLTAQELDYGALYEVRTPHFYVEANKMPTARVRSLRSSPQFQTVARCG